MRGPRAHIYDLVTGLILKSLICEKAYNKFVICDPWWPNLIPVIYDFAKN